jgi:hypothetical protein
MVMGSADLPARYTADPNLGRAERSHHIWIWRCYIIPPRHAQFFCTMPKARVSADAKMF